MRRNVKWVAAVLAAGLVGYWLGSVRAPGAKRGEASPTAPGAAAYVNLPDGGGGRKTVLLTVERAAVGHGRWEPPVPSGDLPLEEKQWLIEIGGNRYVVTPK